MSAPDDLLATLPDVIAARIGAAMPQLATCKGMIGRFDVQNVKDHGVTAPAVLVSRIGARQGQTFAGPVFTYELRLAAFVLVKNAPGLMREEALGRISQVLMRILPDNVWGLPDHVTPARAIEEEPLFSKAIRDQGVALAAITWTQDIEVGRLPADEALEPQVYLGLYPAVGAVNEGAYAEIGAAP